MIDYGEMQKAVRSLNGRDRTLDGVTCPNAYCFGTLEQLNGSLVCTGCSFSRVE